MPPATASRTASRLPIYGVRMEIDEYAVCLKERRHLATVKAFLQVAQDAAKLHQNGVPI